ncbi:hypothetical protein CHISP_2332 [Chitinispirillum alkaliphilum]|nr:hypothetical protein CHISP_2332 [Chitinispirillum alkaliphilum]
MNRVKTAISIAVLMFASITAAQENPVMNLVRENYSPDSYINLEFDHSLFWSVREREEKKSGVLLLAPGEKFRARLGNDILVSDGETYWQYSELNSQVIIHNLSDIDLSYHPSNLLSAHLTGRTFEEVSTQDNLITVKSDQADRQFASVEIVVEKESGIIKQLKMVDNNQNINTYTFNSTVLGESIPAKEFVFDIPENTDVLDMREGHASH